MNRLNLEARTTIKTLAVRGAPTATSPAPKTRSSSLVQRASPYRLSRAEAEGSLRVFTMTLAGNRDTAGASSKTRSYEPCRSTTASSPALPPSLALHHTVQSLLLLLRQSSARGGGRRRTVCHHALDSPGTAGVCRIRTVTELSSVQCDPSGRSDRAGGQEQVLAEACHTGCAVRAQSGLAHVGREDLRLK